VRCAACSSWGGAASRFLTGKYFYEERGILSMANEKKVAREPSFLLALIPIVAMIGFMLYCFLGHSESGYHDAHLPLVMSIVVACIVGHFCGHDFKDMLAGMIERLSASMEAVLILCTVGFLVASFMASGAIPSLIVYGLDLLTP